jgi:hypothetical protein
VTFRRSPPKEGPARVWGKLKKKKKKATEDDKKKKKKATEGRDDNAGGIISPLDGMCLATTQGSTSHF